MPCKSFPFQRRFDENAASNCGCRKGSLYKQPDITLKVGGSVCVSRRVVGFQRTLERTTASSRGTACLTFLGCPRSAEASTIAYQLFAFILSSPLVAHSPKNESTGSDNNCTSDAYCHANDNAPGLRSYATIVILGRWAGEAGR